MPTTFPAMGGPPRLPLPTPAAPVFDVLGTSGAVTTGTINPSSGADVFCDVYVGNGVALQTPWNTAVTYNGMPMLLIGNSQVGKPYVSAEIWRYRMPKVSGTPGSIAVAIAPGGTAGWLVIYSYKNVVEAYFSDPNIGVSSLSFSQPAAPSANGLALWSGLPTPSAGVTSQSGGTSRAFSTTAGAINVQDSSSATSFVLNSSAATNWGSLLTYLLPTTRTGIYLYALWNGVEASKGSPTMPLQVPQGGLVILDVATTAGSVTAVTYGPSGPTPTAMTLLGTVGFNGNTGVGNLYRYYIFDTTGGYNTITVTSTGDTWLTAMVYMNVNSIGSAQTTGGSATSPAVATQSVTCSAGQKIVQSFVTDTIQNTNSAGTTVPWTPSGGTNLVNYSSDAAADRILTVNEADASTTFTCTCSGPATSTGNYAALACVLS